MPNATADEIFTQNQGWGIFLCFFKLVIQNHDLNYSKIAILIKELIYLIQSFKSLILIIDLNSLTLPQIGRAHYVEGFQILMPPPPKKKKKSEQNKTF